MPLTPIQLPPGLERNTTPWDSPDRWWDMDGVRWQSGSILPVGGWTKNTLAPLADAVRKMYGWRAPQSPFVLIGTDSKLYIMQGNFVDITPAGLVPLSTIGVNGGFGTLEFGKYAFGTARPRPSPAFSPFAYWTFDNWGNDGIAVANSDGRLFLYDHTLPTTAPTVVAEAPTSIGGCLVTDERHVMLFGCSVGGTFFPHRVAWCSAEDIHDWDFASLTNTAGFLDLTAMSPLLKGVKVREGVLAFSSTGVHLGTYVGLPYIYGFDQIADTTMMHPDSIVDYNGRAAWFAKDGFQQYASGYVQPLVCPILNDILANMDPTYGPIRVHGYHNGLFPELWWHWASRGQTEADRYAVWNYAENWWAWGGMKRSAGMEAGAYKHPMLGAADGNVYTHEDGWSDAGNSRVGNIWIESGALGALDSVGDVTQLLLSGGDNYDAVETTFYAKLAPQDVNEYLFGPYMTRPDGWTDARVTARSARMRFMATRNAGWSIGKMQADVGQSGSLR